MTFEELGLDQTILQAVAQMGFEKPTPIQEKSIPLVLEGRDVVGCAQTGTGKTAAFVLPTLQRISDRKGVKALVVTPTRELAVQIHKVAEEASSFTGHRVTVVYGGVKYEKQISAMKKGVDLLVATPGRLLDLEGRGIVQLGHVEVLVLDEADRMLDMGFWPDVRKIIRLVPKKRQNLLFSATMSSDVERMIQTTLHDPALVEVGLRSKPVETVHQAIFPVNKRQKADLLLALVDQRHLTRVLVFTRTKQGADRIFRTMISKDIDVEVMHSDRRQTQRQKALESFRSGKVQVLVATDVMARGIDIDDISHVINYDMPDTTDEYVHRIGRTARAGASGSAISFLTAEEMPKLRAIEHKLNFVIPTEDLDGFDYASRAIPNPDRVAYQAPRTVFGGRVMGRRRGGPRRR